jgi:mono/diheme cytochrome c family protein
MKKSSLSLAMLMTVLLIGYSCSSDSDDDPNMNNGNTEVTYATSVKPIIDGNCVGCHGSPTANGAPNSMITYTQVRDAVESRNLIGRIENGSMPPQGNLSSAQIQTIKNWQAGGFKQ